MGDNSEEKNISVCYFYEDSIYIYMKFQDSSFNGLKVTVGTKKCDPCTHACSKSNMPHQHFQSWGHKNTRSKLFLQVEFLCPRHSKNAEGH